MDPLTQGIVGAALPQSIASRPNLTIVGMLGFLAGMAADLDIFIRSSHDPLMFLEYHRQFTHSFIFVPVGGFICAVLLHWTIAIRWHLTFKQTVVFCILGYATHALLDACTTYGTMLFWPFSAERISWSTISIIDPLFTLPILILVFLTAIRKKSLYCRIALIWAFFYISFGLVQRGTAIEMGRVIAANRGHEIIRIEAKPSFANIILWKIIYETRDRFYVDAVRTVLKPRIFIGTSVPKLDTESNFSWLNSNWQQMSDIKRFRWFSDGYLAVSPQHPDQIVDIRYSMVPNKIEALWSIKVKSDVSANTHVEYLTHRQNVLRSTKVLFAMLFED